MAKICRAQTVLLVAAAIATLASCAHDLVDDGALRPISKARIEEDTARRRRLPFLRPVPGQVFDADETDAFVASLAPSPEQDRLYTRVNQKLGIQPHGVTYGEIQAEFLRSGVAAIYLPDEGKMAVFENPLLDQAAILNLPVDIVTGRSSVHGLVVSHEYVHALQDQHFGLDRLVPATLYRDDEDRALAKKSLIETEANLVSYAHAYGMDLERVLQRKGLVVVLELNGVLADLSTEAMVGGVPPFIRESTVRQYDAALAFIDRAMSEGGFARLNQVYVDGGPESTEQLLWPEKYFDERDDPTPIVRDVGIPGVAPDARLYASSFGELQWRVLLSLGLDDAGAGERAAQGWDGDRYEIWDMGERTLLTVRTTWDSEDDAREMSAALARLVEESRYQGRATRLDGALADVDEAIRLAVRPTAAGEAGVHTIVDEEVAIVRVGRDVVMVDGAAPGGALAIADALLASLATSSERAAPLERVALPTPLAPVSSPRPLAEQVALAPRTLELSLTMGASLTDDGTLTTSLIPDLGLRWSFREGVELALPFVITLPVITSERHTLAITGGVTELGRVSSTLPLALITAPSELGFAVTHQVRAFDMLALTGQLSTRTEAPFERAWGASLRAGGAASFTALRRLTLNLGVALEDDLGALLVETMRMGRLLPKGTPSRELVLGSALVRAFMPMPLLEVRVFGGLHLVYAASAHVDAGTLALRAQRHDLGVLLRF